MTDRILVVDDEAGIRDAVTQILEYEGMKVRGARAGLEALKLYGEERAHVVLLDVKMAGMDGLDTLSRLRDLDPGVVVVMISGHGTIATAVEATHRGAFDFLEKPLDANRLLVTVRNALKHRDITGENDRLREAGDARYQMVGDSALIRQVKEVISRVAPTTGRVLILGEHGTGKELVARAVHAGSPRRAKPFVEVNCAAIPAELIESELFGHVKGAFTSAVADREGRFEQADGGTFFLDEIGDMLPSAQAKVLRALQEGVITRVGGTKPIEVDVRVIAATNKNLELEIAEGRFREDLYYRLNVVPIFVPPLRDRLDDIPPLVAHFTAQLAGGAKASGKVFDESAVERLQTRRWPGNVRELRNAVERLLILVRGRTITAADVSRVLGEAPSAEMAAGLAAAASDGTLESFRDQTERVFLAAKLREYDWNISETARAIKVPRSNLYKRIEQLGITRKEKDEDDLKAAGGEGAKAE